MSDDPKDFWDPEDLIPPRKKTPAGRGFPADTSAVEITVPADPAAPENHIAASGRTSLLQGGAPDSPFYAGAARAFSSQPPASPIQPPASPKQQSASPIQPPAGASASASQAATPAASRDTVTGTGGVFADADVPLRERPVNPYAAKNPPRETPETVYRPEHSLLREVRVYPWRTAYMYYEQFRVHALKLHPREGSECEEVDFFSYMPQYTQLTREQLHYYLWWRTNFRKGNCLHAAFSYLLLYLYEQINLSGKILPEEGQQNILRLWLSYRGEHPRLDVPVREWLCDYSLLHRLPPPALPRALYGELLAGCRLKEFYVSGWQGAEEEVLAILLFCNNYDYKKSKFYRADTAELYDRVLSGAVAVALAFLREKGNGIGRGAGVSTITRDAFAGAVCSYRLKRRIEVDYASFSHTHELRYIMTDVLKYAENAIRARISVKSRLTVYQISTELRRVLDAYLDRAIPQKAPTRCEKKAEPDYEKRYEIPVRPVSPERAAKIEAESWETTRKLVEAFGREEEPAQEPALTKGQTAAAAATAATKARTATAPNPAEIGGEPATAPNPAKMEGEPATAPNLPAMEEGTAAAPAIPKAENRTALSPESISAGQKETLRAVETPQNFLDSAGKTQNFPDSFLNNENMFFSGGKSDAFVKNASPLSDKTPENPTENVKEVPADAAETFGEVKEVLPESPLREALGGFAEFIKLAAAGDRAGQRRFAAAHGLMPDAVADRINTAAGDILGDIILEDAGGCYTVIEDYIEDLREAQILD